MLQVFKALSDPCRLRLLAILLRCEFTVQELTAIIGTGQSRISHHLKILTDAGLLSVKRQGTWSYYRVGESSSFFSSIRTFIEQEFDQLPERSADLTAVAAVLEERRRRSLEFFDRHARQWDDLVHSLLPLPDYRRELIDLVPSGGRLLEIGVGTGAFLLELAKVRTGIIGVDHSPAMLAEARRKISQSGLSGVELRLGEMAHLPVPDSSIDCVVANMVLHHAAEPMAVLIEVKRVLVSGGLFLLADLARHEREVAREQLADQWLGFEEEDLARWLQDAGFDNIAFERILGAAGQETVLVYSSRCTEKP